MSSPRFALGTLRRPNSTPFPALIVGDSALDLSVRDEVARPGTTAALLADWGNAVRKLADLARGFDPEVWVPVADLDVLPPLVPENILQSGANYRQHVIDLVVAEHDPASGQTVEAAREAAAQRLDSRAQSGRPYIFSGMRSAMCGALDDVILPLEGEQHDWELELAVVIGRSARRITAREVWDHIAGYTICNDITTRDLLYRPDMIRIGSDWLASKNRPTFLPTGPWLVPSQFVENLDDLRITLSLNGDVMQNESPSDMIFDIPKLVAYASTLIELRPGDLILTGSPAGNGAHWGRFLADGDVMEGSITGLGVQRNRCVRETPPE